MAPRAWKLLTAPALVAAALSCGRAGEVQRNWGAPARSIAQVDEGTDWHVGCERFCDVRAIGETAHELCASLTASYTTADTRASCTPGQALALASVRGSAIRDAAIVNVDLGRTRYPLLAIRGARGWVVARELGAIAQPTGQVRVISARAVDVPGLEPVSAAVRVAIDGPTRTTERLFVCGLSGDGAVRCPVSAIVGGMPVDAELPTAGVAGAIVSRATTWRADVDLTGEGFVVRASVGEIPVSFASLAGEHSWREARAPHPPPSPSREREP